MRDELELSSVQRTRNLIRSAATSTARALDQNWVQIHNKQVASLVSSIFLTLPRSYQAEGQNNITLILRIFQISSAMHKALINKPPFWLTSALANNVHG